MKSRPYQQKDSDRISQALKRHKRVLYVLPAGGGKTHIAVMQIMARIRRGKRALFVAHRREIVLQAVRRLVDAGLPKSKIGVIMAGQPYTPGAPVQVASLQSLGRREKPPADLIVVDEAHRAAADSYVKLLALYPDAQVIGLTATPQRLDGRPLRDAFDDMIVAPSAEDLIRLGFLARPLVFTAPDEALPDLAGVRSQMGDYEPKALDASVSRVLVGDVVKHYEKHARGMSSVLFAVNIAQAKRYRDTFARVGYACEHIDGSTDPIERDAIIERLRTGETRIVTSCDVLVEGWDAPWVKCMICVRPTRSIVKWVQMSGRVMRPWRDVGPVILDHAGNALRLGLPQDDRPWSLDTSIRQGDGEAPCKRCEECGNTAPIGALECCNCGCQFPPRPSHPKEVDGELVRIVPRFTLEEIDADRAKIAAFAKSRGFKIGWVDKVIAAKFGDDGLPNR